MDRASLHYPFPDLIGESPAMLATLAAADRVAPTAWPVLITGETGTGKTVLARGIHAASGRSGRFVALNCAALPGALLESQLFGHERGAFTGATEAAAGLIEAAGGGTLFLDEIGDMALEAQARLLRVLESGRVRRLGAADETVVDVRLIAATHRDLPARVEAGAFRQDLLYRINSFALHMPALRERPDDVAALAGHFLAAACGEAAAPVLDASVVPLLCARAWPGNLRELEATIRRAVLDAGDAPSIGPDHLLPPDTSRSAPPPEAADTAAPADTDVVWPTAEEAPTALAEAMDDARRNRARWARALLALAARVGGAVFYKRDMIPLMQEARGPDVAETTIINDWERDVRQAIVASGLLARTGKRLKVDIDRCRAVFAASPLARRAPAPAAAPPVVAPDSAVALPPAPALIGRDADVADLVERLSRPHAFVTLTGPGGIGKTSLALAAAHALHAAGRMPGGCVMVDLRDATTPDAADAAVARALTGNADSGDTQPVAALLALRRAPLLLVLDNVEQLVDHAAATVGAWRRTDAPLHLLVTSRRTLELAGEVRVEVGALAVPPVGATPEQVVATDAVRLLVERAADARPGFALDPVDAPTAAQVCRELAGIPLAVELAAARLAALSLPQLADRLGDKFRLLRSRRRDAPDHQQTLEQTLAFSHDLLTPASQAVFRQLSVFRGGFSLEAAEAVLAPDVDMLDALERLVAASLVRLCASAEPEPRYDMYLPVREYAAMRLAEVTGAAALLQRHADWYAALADAQSPGAHLGHAAGMQAWRRLAADRDNLTAARAHAVAVGDASCVARLSMGLDAVLLLADADAERAMAVLDESARLLSDAPGADPLLAARLTLHRARMAGMARHTGVTLAGIDAAITTCAGSADPAARPLQAALTVSRGLHSLYAGEQSAGLAAFVEARQQRERLGDDAAAAEPLLLHGAWLALTDPDGASGLDELRDAIRMLATDGPSRIRARALHRLGYELMRRGQVDAGSEHHAQAIRMADELGLRMTAARYRAAFAHQLLAAGHTADAAVHAGRLRADAAAVGMPAPLVASHILDADLAFAAGDYRAVLASAPAVRRLAEETGLAWALHRDAPLRARALAGQGRGDEALAALDAAAPDDGRLSQFLWHAARAVVLDSLGRADDARAAAANAVRVRVRHFTNPVIEHDLAQLGDAVDAITGR